MATVDILLPVKNGAEFLAESIDTVVMQTFRDWRLLVLDHGSTDGTVELVDRYRERDARIELHSFPEAQGLSGLLNRGLDLCDCRYMMRQDADDNSTADRIEITLEAFKAQPECVAIGGQADCINTRGEFVGRIAMPVGRLRFAAASLFRNPMLHSAAILDFPRMRKMGVRYGADFINALPEGRQLRVRSLAEDYFLFGQLGILGKCANLPQKVMENRWHDTKVSVRHFGEQMEMSLAISRNLMRSLCALHGVSYVDPAPFCNHGAMLFNIENQVDFSDEYRKMADALRQIWGASEEIERELAYRWVTATRNRLLLLWRYNRYQARHRPDLGEWNAVRSWVLKSVPGKAQWKRTRFALREAAA